MKRCLLILDLKPLRSKTIFFKKILLHTEFIGCWSCAGGQPFVVNCSQSEIWKEFSGDAQACTFIMLVLKMIKQLKVGI